MSDVTVKEFAESINTPPQILLEQLNDAGIKVKSADDVITEDQKATLLEHLRSGTKSGPKKITLNRKKTSEIKVASGGQARTVAVETRKTRTYVKREDIADNVADNAIEDVAANIVENIVENIAIEAIIVDSGAPIEAAEPIEAVEVVKAVKAVKDVKTPKEKPTKAKAKSKKESSVDAVAAIAESIIPESIEDTQAKDIAAKELAAKAKLEEASKLAAESERIRQQEAILKARARATEEAQQKQLTEDKRKQSAERKRLEEIQKISDTARSVAEGSTISKVAISFKSDEKAAALIASAAAKEARAKLKESRARTSERPAPRQTPDRPSGDRPSGERPPRPASERTNAARPAGERVNSTRPSPQRPASAPSPSSDANRGNNKPGNKSTKDLDALRQDGRNKGGAANKKGRNSEKFVRFGGNDDDASQRRGGNKRKKPTQDHGFNMPTSTSSIEVGLPETISVSDLAHKMSLKGTAVVKALMKLGSMVTINQILDQETAAIVVEELGHTYKMVAENALEEELNLAIAVGTAVNRAPVVTIMGHVDHGKTSTLDYIRRTHVATGEAGGITQHIGAYHVNTPNGMVTFLDTPGHSAFTAMRARGAKITDIVVLVVAIDDGVMPQTIEAIQHAKAANVPLVIAVNKIDKPGTDREHILAELSQHGVISEEWGGDNIFCYISAKTGEGIDNLLNQILVQSEVLELAAIADGPAKGTVIESRLDKGRGPVATVLVQSGLLKKGDIILAGVEYGHVRLLMNEKGEQILEAGPSIPVEVLGLSGIPSAGDDMVVVQDERKAREIALFRQGKFRDVKLARLHTTKLENIFENMAEGKITTVNVVLKADVQGSIEAISNALTDLSNDEVRVKIVSTGVGGITETDANLAVASSAIVIGFNVRADASARRIIEEDGLDLHYYSIIYEVVDEIKRALEGKLAPEFKEEIIGIAEVRDVFRSPKFGAIAGCMVTEGLIKRKAPIRVLREHVVIYQGELESLRRFKEDVNEVRNGYECGIGVKNYNDVKVGDQIEVFERIQVVRTL